MLQKISMRRATLFALALLFTTHLASACSESTSIMSTIAYPETKRVDVVEEHFGQAIADPYRWLENDVRNDQEVAAWVEAQNKVTYAYLDTLPGRDIFRDRLRQLYNYERFSIPVKKGGRYFYLHNSGLQNQQGTCLFSSPALNEKDVVKCGTSNRKSWIQCSHDHRL